MTPPAQRRSQETLDRILEATEVLLDGRGFNEISVLEICTAADVSASSFYARFDSKERLLAVLHQRHLDERREQVREAIPALLATDLDVRGLMEVAATAYVSAHIDEAPLVQTLRRAELDDSSLADNRRALDRFAVEAVAEALMTRMPDADEWLRRRIAFATRCACAALQDAVLPPFTFAEDVSLDVEATVRETVEMWSRYVLGIDGDG